MRSAVAAALASLCVLAAAPPGARIQEGALPMAVLDEGTLSGVDEPRRVVVRSAGAWRSLWREHAGDRPAPDVDFDRDTVIAVFAGSRPTAGWTVRIRSVVPEDDGVRVRVDEHGPGAGQAAAQILTTPFQIVSVPRFTGAAVFDGPR